MWIIVIILAVLLLGGGGWGYRSGAAYGTPAIGIGGILILVLIVLLLTGRL